jgi:hypothetical protein
MSASKMQPAVEKPVSVRRTALLVVCQLLVFAAWSFGGLLISLKHGLGGSSGEVHEEALVFLPILGACIWAIRFPARHGPQNLRWGLSFAEAGIAMLWIGFLLDSYA